MILVYLPEDWPNGNELELKAKIREKDKEIKRLKREVLKLKMDLVYYQSKSCFQGLFFVADLKKKIEGGH